jgi:hypothetical protein
MTDKKEIFVIELIKFYKASLSNSAESIRVLSKLQSKFPAEYELFKKSSLDPGMFLEMLESLDDTSRGILIDIYIKQDVLTKKLNLLFQMSSEDKLTFATDLEKFGKLVDLKIKKLLVDKKGENHE